MRVINDVSTGIRAKESVVELSKGKKEKRPTIDLGVMAAVRSSIEGAGHPLSTVSSFLRRLCSLLAPINTAR